LPAHPARSGHVLKDTSDIVQSDNRLFIPLSSWFGDYVIRGTYYQADDPAFVGKIGAARPQMEGQEHPCVLGGGGVVMSRHSKNPQLRLTSCLLTTDEIKNQGTYPAYVPRRKRLKTRMPTLTYLATPPRPVKSSR
jgi:hypothetical protein